MFCFATPWFLTLFVYNLPAECAARLWDAMFLLGVDRSQPMLSADEPDEAITDAVLVELPAAPTIDTKDTGSIFGLSIAEAASRRAKRKAQAAGATAAAAPPPITFSRAPLHDAFLQRFSLAVLRHLAPELLKLDFHGCVRMLHQLPLTVEHVTKLCEASLDEIQLVARSQANTPLHGPRVVNANGAPQLPRPPSLTLTKTSEATATPSESAKSSAQQAPSISLAKSDSPAAKVDVSLLPGVVWETLDAEPDS